MQMPPEMPVLAVGPKNPSASAKHAQNYLEKFQGITLIERTQTKDLLEKTVFVLKELGAKYTVSTQTDYADKKQLYIDFVPLEQTAQLPKTNSTVIIVPAKKESKAQDTLQLIDCMQEHLWVGLNRAENAGIAAVQLLNVDNKFETKLKAFRKNTEKKVIDADKKEFKKWNGR